MQGGDGGGGGFQGTILPNESTTFFALSGLSVFLVLEAKSIW